jgi:predicted DNA-binding transcriptional regulator YafY
MNRLDRLYALVEELRAAGPRGKSARRLAEHFEVSVRTIERDILALQEAGVPISAQTGRRGGYMLDSSMTLPPLNFTPAEAVAMAVGLRRLDDTPWARDARTALLKVVAAMPEGAATRARTLADGVRLLVQPLSAPDQQVADAVVRGDGAGCVRTSASSAWTASTRCSCCLASSSNPSARSASTTTRRARPAGSDRSPAQTPT